MTAHYPAFCIITIIITTLIHYYHSKMAEAARAIKGSTIYRGQNRGKMDQTYRRLFSRHTLIRYSKGRVYTYAWTSNDWGDSHLVTGRDEG